MTLSTKRILVLGGTGFVGRHVCEKLNRMGCSITVITRRASQASAIQSLPHVKVIEVDVYQPEFLTQQMAKHDVLINLIAILHGSEAAFDKAHVQLPQIIAKACQASGLHRLIHISALGASLQGPSHYQRSKARGEEVLKQAGLALTVLQPSVIFGVEDKFLNLFAKLQQLTPVVPLAGANTRFQAVWVEDVASAVAHCVMHADTAGKTYEQDGALWLRSTDYGDDKDRVMRKSDGTYTYFVPDVAYHITKWERGFTRVVNIQGTDHHGTIARVRAGLQAANVGIPTGYPDYVLHTMVRVVRGGEEVKISKRAGSYVTLSDLIEWTSKDAVRFFLLSRKPDTESVFDIDLALAQNNDNPVFYVQYAHARICSVLLRQAWPEEAQRNALSPEQRVAGVAQAMADLQSVDLQPLDSPPARALMLKLAQYPEMLSAAARDFAPHDVSFYLRDLAASYHSYYDAERIWVDDVPVRQARMALVAATAQVLHNGLQMLGVSAPTSM